MNPITSWLYSARDWLDARGRSAWIVAMILGFVFVWPLGLALLFYMILSNRMNCRNRIAHRRHRFPVAATGNTAFDSYRDETLKRLEEEQTAFQGFLQRLRDAKDKSEFDQFMNERKSGTDNAEVA